VEHADVRAQGPGGEQALARVGAHDLGDPELRDEVGAAGTAGREERQACQRGPEPRHEEELAVLERADAAVRDRF
jgi:hypothetical protein